MTTLTTITGHRALRTFLGETTIDAARQAQVEQAFEEGRVRCDCGEEAHVLMGVYGDVPLCRECYEGTPAVVLDGNFGEFPAAY